MCYADAHAAIIESTCIELPRGPWSTGHVWRVMTVRSVRYAEKQRGTLLGSETTSLSPCHMSYNPPRSITLSHRITYTPCRAAMAPWLLCYLRCVSQEGSAIFSLFSLIELHLVSHPLASSYSRVTVSSKKCCLNLFCSSMSTGPR